MRRYPHTVTFQEAVTSRTPSGQVVADTYENVDGLVDLPARVVAEIEEAPQERMVTTEDLYRIFVQGDRAVRPDMVALTEEGVFDVRRVANPPSAHRLAQTTVVIAERVAL